jgi:PAS domain S-box-containing protein
MTTELVFFLKTYEEPAIRDWVNSLDKDSLVHAALPQRALKPLVKQTYHQIVALIENPHNGNDDFSGLSYIRDHHINGIDTLLGLQTVLLKGRRMFFQLTATKIDDRQTFIDFFRKIDEIFHQFILKVTSYFTLKSISPHYTNLSSEPDQNDISPSRLNLFYNAFQNSTDSILITDLNGAIIEVNKAFLDIFGYEYDEVIGQSTSLLRSSHTTDAFYQMMWASIKKEGNWKGEIVNRKKDGEEIPVLLSITPVYENEQIVGYMGVEIDIRKQKKMEERLLQSERFAAIGQMAAKVSHEIRNPLSSISLNSELLEDEIRAAGENVCSDAKSLLQSIMSEVDRLTKLTDEYLQFSRLPGIAPEKGDIVELIKEILGFFEAEANSVGIQIRTSFEKKLPKLSFDSQQIRRLVLNLLRNALEAMPGGGMIKIAIQKKSDVVILSFSDTGHGISENVGNKIFAPFYTTKDMGTGLGLALCSQIVREHGGRIWAESTGNIGATFFVELPLKWRSKTASETGGAGNEP